MNPQEVLDSVVLHLLTQNERAEGPCGCLYRAPSGLKCAIGGLIVDEHYSPDLEHKYPHEAEVAEAIAKSLKVERAFTMQELNFLRNLQKVHDGYPIERWRNTLEELALRWGLKFNPPKFEEKAPEESKPVEETQCPTPPPQLNPSGSTSQETEVTPGPSA